jgi:hypothetical protein
VKEEKRMMLVYENEARVETKDAESLITRTKSDG